MSLSAGNIVITRSMYVSLDADADIAMGAPMKGVIMQVVEAPHEDHRVAVTTIGSHPRMFQCCHPSQLTLLATSMEEFTKLYPELLL